MCEISTDMSRTTELKGEGGKKKKKRGERETKKNEKKISSQGFDERTLVVFDRLRKDRHSLK